MAKSYQGYVLETTSEDLYHLNTRAPEFPPSVVNFAIQDVLANTLFCAPTHEQVTLHNVTLHLIMYLH